MDNSFVVVEKRKEKTYRGKKVQPIQSKQQQNLKNVAKEHHIAQGNDKNHATTSINFVGME
jgi:hypothetical protein